MTRSVIAAADRAFRDTYTSLALLIVIDITLDRARARSVRPSGLHTSIE
jgi:hypothetical protein